MPRDPWRPGGARVTAVRQLRPVRAVRPRPAIERELDAAGVDDPVLRESYRRCERLHAVHGRTYHLATRLLPAAKRPHVHALYGFARYADEIVDDVADPRSAEERAAALDSWGDAFLADLKGGGSDDPICAAVIATALRYGLAIELFEAFLASMRSDLTVTEYATFDDLRGYMYGSAAVIGLQMLPVLGAVSDGAEPYAADLGIAFQLANFLRDVGEDLRRGRLYLPLEDLAAFGVRRDDLAVGVVDGRIRRLLAFEIARTREIFRAAAPGIRLLAEPSRECIATAFVLYGGILDAIEDADYQVLDRRVRVGWRRRLSVAGPAYLRARAREHASRAGFAALAVGTTRA